ncbi:hypothetical protein C1H46_043310 [Malus baccata]|uniref:Uncharacterized protein n=1 Tax=Malus baccata TaxID=106549 RepID=A0A540KA95_MALBA|nr:hypothetical protein C1H46_043310 [Malus baccata]
MAEDYETDDFMSESIDDHLLSDPNYFVSKESIQFADGDLNVYNHIVEKKNIEDDHVSTVEDQGDNIPKGDNILGDDTTEYELRRVMQSLPATLNDIPSHDHRRSQHFVSMTMLSIRHMLAETIFPTSCNAA